jgi:hypothetical protein
LRVLEVLATLGHHPGKPVRPIKIGILAARLDTCVYWCCG